MAEVGTDGVVHSSFSHLSFARQRYHVQYEVIEIRGPQASAAAIIHIGPGLVGLTGWEAHVRSTDAITQCRSPRCS
jgi:hypothetical protein